MKRKIPLIAGFCLFLLAFVALYGVNAVTASVAGLGCIALLGTVGAVLPEAEFQKKVLDGMEATQTKTEKLVSDFGRLDKETKSAFEDLTKLKKTANDLSSDRAEFTRKMGEIDGLLRRQARAAYGCPVQRISSDKELRRRVNAAVRHAAAGSEDRIKAIANKMSEGIEQRALTTGATPGSTFMIEELASEIYDLLGEYGVWNTFGVQRMGTSVTRFPVTTALPVAKAVRKLASRKLVEDTTLAGTSVDAEAVLWGVFLGVEQELLMDADYDVTGYVLENFALAMAKKFDEICLTADGTDDADDSTMTGVFFSGTASVATAGRLTVEATKLEDWTKALITAGPVVQSRAARWWMNPQQVVRALGVKDDNGRPIFLTAIEAPSAGAIGSILGYPVTRSLVAPTANAANAKIAVFGDGRGHAFGLRMDFGISTSDDFAFDGVKRMFRGLAYAGTKTKTASAFSVFTLPAA